MPCNKNTSLLVLTKKSDKLSLDEIYLELGDKLVSAVLGAAALLEPLLYREQQLYLILDGELLLAQVVVHVVVVLRLRLGGVHLAVQLHEPFEN